MPQSTNRLVAVTKKLGVPAGLVGAFALGAAIFVGHGRVSAAAQTPPLSESSIAPLTALDQAMEAVAAKVTPSVVNVAVTARGNADDEEGQTGPQQQQQLPPGLQQFFGQFFGQGPQQPPQQQLMHGVGSGVIISPDGYIVTNDHVVNGAVQIKVTLNDRRVLPAKVVGVDKLTDLAVVKIDAHNLPSITWGDSSKLEPGQTVLAFGSPFGYFQFSVTRGIVSAVNRPNPYSTNARKPGSYIQTDAAINPGNSGGPLVNVHGELVGINTFIITNSGQFAGAGFAIPSQMVKAISQEIIKHGKVEHGYLGISMNDVTPDNAQFFNLKEASGAIVADVTPDSPASKGGLKRGDVIVQANGQKIENGSALQVVVSEMTPNTPLTLTVMRNGNPVTLHLTVGQFHGTGQEASNEGESGNRHARLGVTIENLDAQARQQFNVPDQIHGVVVTDVKPGSPADDAGLQPGDVIQEVNRKPVASVSEFANLAQASPADKDMLLLVWSHGNSSYRTIHPDENVQ